MNILNEMQFRFISSPGPGGQNVNKVATAVQLEFNISASKAISPAVKDRLKFIGRQYIDQKGQLMITAHRYRSQERNKQDAIDRFLRLVEKAKIPPVKRFKTKPTFSSQVTRLEQKKQQSRKKSDRQKIRDF